MNFSLALGYYAKKYTQRTYSSLILSIFIAYSSRFCVVFILYKRTHFAEFSRVRINLQSAVQFNLVSILTKNIAKTC